MDGVPVDLEPVGDLGHRERVERGDVDVDHALAPGAHEMVVAVRARIVVGTAARVAGLHREAHADERIEHAIDGRAGHLGHAAPHVVEKPVGGGVVVPLGERVQNHPPLCGEGQAMTAAGGFETAEALDGLAHDTG